MLDRGSNEILIKNLRNEVTKKTPAPAPGTDAIFYAGTGVLLCRAEDKARPSVPRYRVWALGFVVGYPRVAGLGFLRCQGRVRAASAGLRRRLPCLSSALAGTRHLGSLS